MPDLSDRGKTGLSRELLDELKQKNEQLERQIAEGRQMEERESHLQRRQRHRNNHHLSRTGIEEEQIVSKPRILVVEDQGIVAEDIRENLERVGYEVPGIVASGEEAVRRIREIGPDLVMMDIHLRGEMDGVEAAGRIYEQFDVPVVFLTAYADAETLRCAKESQPFGYLIKPFKEKELHTAIEIALYKHGVEMQLRDMRDELQNKVEALERQDDQIRKLSRAVEQSPAAVIVTDTEGRIEYVNRQFTEITGYASAEVVGENPRILKSGKQSPEFYRELWMRIREGEVWRGEFCNRKKDGSLYWEAASISPVRGSDGEIAHYVAVKEDITERKRQEELEQVRQQMREEVWKMRGPEDIKRLLEVVKDSLKRLEVPFQGCGINVISERSDEITVHAYELDEKGCWESKGEEEVPEILVPMWREQKVNYRRDLASEDPDQERGRVSGKFGLVRSVLDVPFSHGTLAVNSPEPNAFSEEDIASLQVLAETLSEGFYRLDDLRALEAKEEQFRQSQKMEAIGQLAGGMAHDFNNLLTVITGYCQLLLRILEPDSLPHQNVQEIMRAGDRAAVMVRQLLSFSRRQVVEPQVVDLNEVIGDMDEMLRRVIGEDVELVTEPGPELGKVEADPGQLEQVIMNLAVNARDAMPDGGRLVIETANAELDQAYADRHARVRPGPHVMLAVSDTGTGMDAETRTRIFEPFFTTKEKGKGTGLGLATVYGIVQQSNGYIWVYSEPGEGTTFKIYLPRTDAESRPQESASPEAEEELDGAETVLVVEDDDTVRQLVQRTLEERGYSVRTARNGDEGLRIGSCEEEKIDLLLTDVIMPGMRGYQLAEKLLVVRPDLKVLYMSGYTDRGFDSQRLKGDSADFLAKPFIPEEMLRKIRGLLDGGNR